MRYTQKSWGSKDPDGNIISYNFYEHTETYDDDGNVIKSTFKDIDRNKASSTTYEYEYEKRQIKVRNIKDDNSNDNVVKDIKYENEIEVKEILSLNKDYSILLEPNDNSVFLGYAKKDEQVNAISKIEDGNFIWYKIGDKRWIKKDNINSTYVNLEGINSDNFEEYVNGKYYACKTYDEENAFNGNYAKEFCVFKFNIDGDNLHFEKYDFTNKSPVVFTVDKNAFFTEWAVKYGQFRYDYKYVKMPSSTDYLASYKPTDDEHGEQGPLNFKAENNEIMSFPFKTLKFKGRLYDDLDALLENEAIGTVTINAKEINMRADSSTNFDVTGSVSQGQIYNVYEIVDSQDLTWYQIGCNKWIADDGNWLTFTPKQ